MGSSVFAGRMDRLQGKQNVEKKAEEGGFLANVNQRKLVGTSDLLGLLKWNTPTVYNGWEQITGNPNYGRSCFNLEPIQDHSPEMGPMVGYAVTVKIQPGKIEVVQDLSKPVIYGSMWGEVNATFFKS